METGEPPTEHHPTSADAQASSSISSSRIHYPRQWLNSYTNFVQSNAAQVTQLESALRSLVYILPGKFQETPITAEALHTGLTLLTSFHTHLLSPSTYDPAHLPTPQTRYEKWAGGKSRLYKRVVELLRTVQYTQLLLEMFAKRAGEKARWRVVIMLEVLKALCRVLMLRLTGARTLIGSEVGAERQERRMDEPAVESSGSEVLMDGHGASKNAIDREWTMPRTGMKLPRLPSPELGESIVNFLEKRVITAEEVKSAQSLVHKLQTLQGLAGEVTWILRPVIYALALQHVQGNKRDWRPWLLGLGLELVSRQLSKEDIHHSVVGGMRGVSSVEREELTRRGWCMAWWGMRGAFYNSVTGPWIKGVAGKLKGKPLLDMVGIIVEEYDWLWEEYYFSTATV
ncbi:MAG: hypothetical protein Q9163_000198 [Psora crenata]